MRTGCDVHRKGFLADPIQACPALAVAEWTSKVNDHRAFLCKRHLDMWLDNADDEPPLEPARLEWLDTP